ncbi:MAG: hypothetical protein HZC36_03175 [Armatimonadetes bacterium]|nr:hypothetical protein [Armatimonadota bacterium]
MITTYLPWIAIAAGIAALFSRDGLKAPPESPPKSPPNRLVWAILGLLAAVALWAGFTYAKQAEDVKVTAIGFVVGLALAAASNQIGGSGFQRGASLAGPIGLAAIARGLGSLAFVPEWLTSHEVGLGVGVAVGAWLLAKPSDTGWAWKTAAILDGTLLVDLLGEAGPGDRAAHAGLALLVAGCVLASALPTLITASNLKNKLKESGTGILFAAVFSGFAVLIATRYVWIGHVWHIALMASALALVVHWFTASDNEGSPYTSLLGMVIWLGVATLAFGLLRGFGMSIALLTAVLVFLILGDVRSIASLSPLAAMTVYRVFKEWHQSAAKTLDIGQHYELIGFIAGMALIALALEMRQRRREHPIASGAMALMLMALPILTAILLGAKGTVGLLVGSGFAYVVLGSALHGLAPFVLQMGLGLLIAGTYDWYASLIDLTRDQKVFALEVAVPIVAVLLLLIGFLTKPVEQARAEAS